jgi:nucleotide-binding universal stress UspA family protein
MTDQKPKHILCAVRGGQESRNTVVRAIDLALENDARLTFFHILDAEFLGAASLTRTPVRSIYEQLHEMGEFTMLILCDRASRRGVTRVDYKVQEGNIKQLLRQMAIETHADIMVMGRPVRSPGSNVFTKPDFDDFIKSLQADTDPHIIVVTPDPADIDVNAAPHGIIPPEDETL